MDLFLKQYINYHVAKTNLQSESFSKANLMLLLADNLSKPITSIHAKKVANFTRKKKKLFSLLVVGVIERAIAVLSLTCVRISNFKLCFTYNKWLFELSMNIVPWGAA